MPTLSIARHGRHRAALRGTALITLLIIVTTLFIISHIIDIALHLLRRLLLRDIAKNAVSGGVWAAIAKHGTRLVGALSAMLNWATDYLYFRMALHLLYLAESLTIDLVCLTLRHLAVALTLASRELFLLRMESLNLKWKCVDQMKRYMSLPLNQPPLESPGKILWGL